MAKQRRIWFTNVAAYTIAGTATSALTGGILGYTGSVVLPEFYRPFGLVVAVSVALMVLARDLHLTEFTLPQIGRQTQGLWAKRYGGRAAAIMWGLDLGFTFTTWINPQGAWVLAVLAVASGEPEFGVLLFMAYWLGRALPVWISPLLMMRATGTALVMASLDGQKRLFQRVHMLGVIWSMAILGWLLFLAMDL